MSHPPGPVALAVRDEDSRLLAARLVAARHPGQWVSAVVVLVLFATSPGSTFQTLLTSNASKCSATGKKPWTVQYFSDSAPIFLGLANGKVDRYFGPTLSLKCDAAHIAGTKFLGQISSTPVGFVTAKGSPIAKALSAAVNELIVNGDYAKIFAKWDVGSDLITKSALNPATTF